MNGVLRTVSRREFLGLCGVAGTGFLLGIRLGSGEAFGGEGESVSFVPNAFLGIDADGTVTIWASRSELGQGVHTALPMLVAEELEAEWGKVRVEPAALDPKYGNQGTGGSMSIRESWEPLRRAGAAAREMLVAAAAQTWGVGAGSCRAESGAVIHAASGRRLEYGALVQSASRLPVPASPRLKDPKEFRLLGTPVLRLDVPSKVDGSARFGFDTKVPGMLYAALARSPVFGGEVERVDDAAARRVSGVREVVPLRASAAVVADSTWAAFEGRDALRVTWNEGANAAFDSPALARLLEEASSREGADGRADSDVEAVLARAALRLDAVYLAPFAYHGPMEPMNCVADASKEGRCEVWAPTQFPAIVRQAVAGYLQIPPDAVAVNVTLSGGGFGRRIEADYAVEAAIVSRRVGAPVQVVWSREDDVQHDWYRPISRHVLRAAVEKGRLTAWSHRIVTPSIAAQRRGGAMEGGYDEQTLAWISNVPYAVPHIHADSVLVETPVPIGWWRSVYASQNAFATECFLDEVSAAMGRDPVELRRDLLARSPRHRAVVELAAAKSGWGSPPPPGRARGVALCESFGSYVAEVAEVSVGPDGSPRVHRVTCAVDCGMTVNPEIIRQQIEGAVCFALTPVLHGPITIARGRVEQGNFDDYPVVTMSEMPEVDVHIVPSREAPGGIGEPGVPPLAPAVANAFSALTGRRVRSLPIRPRDLAAE